jgi:RimJ/RimL family protein N-acetyltransferase/ADP-ribose pyrophosphatase YjhB (NUDIX family)
MELPKELRTDRLGLRRWRPEDREPFARLNADPRVMEFFPKPLSREESDASVDRIEAHFQHNGFGLWAVEVLGVTPFAGFIGLAIPRFEAAFTPCMEIGWRLDSDHWNRGYATEGARAALDFGFEWLQAEEIISFTVPANVRSRRVMEKIGMRHSPSEDFEHPLLPEGHPLRRHVLYRLGKPKFAEQRAPSHQAAAIPTFGIAAADAEYLLRPGGYTVIWNAVGELAAVATPLGLSLPGGGQNIGEKPEEAAARETEEECGLSVFLGPCIGVADELVFAAEEGTHYRKRCTFFLAEIMGRSGPGEADHKLVWLSPEDSITKLIHGSQRWAVSEACRLAKRGIFLVP